MHPFRANHWTYSLFMPIVQFSKKTPRNFSGTFTKLAELFFCLAVIGVGTVLALIVLIDDVSWKRRGIGFQLQGI